MPAICPPLRVKTTSTPSRLRILATSQPPCIMPMLKLLVVCVSGCFLYILPNMIHHWMLQEETRCSAQDQLGWRVNERMFPIGRKVHVALAIIHIKTYDNLTGYGS